jgi:hypothetical protein
MTDDELDCLLSTLRADSGSHLGSVSERVMARIAKDARRQRLVTWAALAATAALATVALSIPRENARLAVAVSLPAAPTMTYARRAPAPSPEPPIVTSRVAAPIRAASVRPQVAHATPLEVRMQTDDPDVLIIWLVDSEEEQKGNR